MGKYRTWHDGVLLFQSGYQLVHIFFGRETQAVHACVQFDVYGPVGDALFLSSLCQGVHQAEAIHFGLQIIVKHCFESRHFRIHDNDALGDSVLPQCHSFVCHRYCEIVHSVVL